MKKILILAYPGIGKTYLADNFENIVDFEFQHYRYDYGEYKNLPLEKLKGRTEIRTLRPEWPENYFKALEEELKKDKIVLIPFVTSLLDVLYFFEQKDDTRVILAIKDKKFFKDLSAIFKNRGNGQEFIERRKKDFVECHDVIENTTVEKMIVPQGKYLSDSLIAANIELRQGKGSKNYF